MTAMVDIKPLDEAAEPAWEAFVETAPDATFFHRAGWARVIAKAYGHPTYFRYASRGGRIVGVLPLVHVKSPLFGNALISTGFCTFGGIVATDEGAALALAKDAAELGRSLGVDHVELRHTAALPIDWMVKSELYAAFRRPMDADIGVTWGQLPQQKRQELRRSIKSGLRQQVGPELLGEFFRGGQFLRDFPGSVAGEHKPVVCLSLEQNSFKDVLAQIDAKNRISASRHDAPIPCSGNRADRPVFWARSALSQA